MSEKTGDILKYLRKKHNFTQRDIGKFLNLSQSQLAKVESNERNLKFDSIKKLCNLYNVSEEFILYGEGEFDENTIAFRKDNRAIDLETLARMNKIINNLKTMNKIYQEHELND
jgi:transcriptional regulator with XRE-family HTH domain